MKSFHIFVYLLVLLKNFDLENLFHYSEKVFNVILRKKWDITDAIDIKVGRVSIERSKVTLQNLNQKLP